MIYYAKRLKVSVISKKEMVEKLYFDKYQRRNSQGKEHGKCFTAHCQVGSMATFQTAVGRVQMNS